MLEVYEAALTLSTVEVLDPSDLFDAVQPLLAQRLPLKDLNWKSPNRPLRSISSLNVDLIRAKTRSSGTSQDDGPTQRRHQIPGLRKTPYLKIYLLRCDDKEAYKTTSRKLVREWVKTVQSSGSSTASNSEGYDACEWMILHVVLPDTPAASEPRISKRSSDGPSDSTESVVGKSKWPGRGTSTVLEKLKADFNSSSKSATDRVAQIRLGKGGDSQSSVLSTGLSQGELEAAWQDVMEKIKTSVLTSFDMRVRQYEDDIRERDSQRSLPGWNFCTFFILKEGLAIGFEEVGLFEDALVGYDELSYGLDIVIREQAAGEGDEHGGILSLSTEDLHTKLETLLLEAKSTSSDDKDIKTQRPASISLQLNDKEFPVDPNSKAYRELILANNISIFDFRVYIFARQTSLLLKAARQADHHSKTSINEDFLLLTEICHRTTEFIGIGSRTLQEDLQQSLWRHEEATSFSGEARDVIENIVHSWIYCVSLQIVTQTSSAALDLPRSGILDPQESNMSNGQLEQGDLRSLRSHHDTLRAPNGGMDPQPTITRRPSQNQLNGQGRKKPTGSKTGTEELATARGELYLTARKVLQKIGSSRSWRTDWDDLGTIATHHSSITSEMQDVALDDKNKPEINGKSSRVSLTVSGLEPAQLRLSGSMEEAFKSLFNALSDQAYRHFLAGNKLKSAENLVADIALQKYRARDYPTAASLFRRLSAFYESESWPTLSGTLLELYARCLKQLNDGPDYINVLIKLLAFSVREQGLGKGSMGNSQVLSRYYDELVISSNQLPMQIPTPFNDLFEITSAPSRIIHHLGRDGFYLSLGIRSLLPQPVNISDGLALTLKCVSDLYGPTITLHCDGPCTIQDASSNFNFESNIAAFGTYVLDELSFRVGQLHFILNFEERHRKNSIGPEPPIDITDKPQPSIVLYPAPRAAAVKISPRKQIKLGERAQMELELHSGWNDITECTLRIKPATAGLRLRTVETTIIGGDDDVDHEMQVVDVDGSQSIQLKSLKPESGITISVPYTVESPEVVQLEVRLEFNYTTETGSFTLLQASSMNPTLPVSVNVQDLFRSTTLLSRFTIGSATLIPLRLLDCHIEGTSQVQVTCGMDKPIDLEISPKQPASLLYRFTPKWKRGASSKDRTLLLKAEYVCLDEQALKSLERIFKAELLASPISSLTGLLLPHLLHVFRSQWTANDLETISTLRVIKQWSYEEFDWDAVLRPFGKETASQATMWLKAWHSANGNIPLVEVSVGSNLSRHVIIDVELPSPPAVITASLRTLGQGTTALPVGLGQALTAELCLCHSEEWASKVEADRDKPLEVLYELTTNPDTWLVGGRKRGNFLARPGREGTFPIILLPQRAGYLPLPSVEIKCFKIDDEGSDNTSWRRNEVQCEVDYRSHAKCVLVIPDLRETTVALDGEGAGRGEWLVGSRRHVELG